MVDINSGFKKQPFSAAQLAPQQSATSITVQIETGTGVTQPQKPEDQGIASAYNGMDKAVGDQGQQADYKQLLQELKSLLAKYLGKDKAQPSEKPSTNSKTPSQAGTAKATQQPTQAPTKKDSLAGIAQEEKDAVQGKDLSATDEKGNPLYLVAEGKDGKKHIYEMKEGSDGKKYKAVAKLEKGSNNLYVKDPEKNRVEAKKETGQTAKAEASSSSPSVSLTVDGDGNITIDVAVSGAGAGEQGGETKAGAGASGTATAGVEGEANVPKENKGGGKTASPLILDTNKDGEVSAEQGKGVDIDGDGKADGAAAGGDKMLALGDLNKDGQISGSEVFGDKTVDPFTGKALNASNGFEALKMVAQSAEEQTGQECIDDEGKVDVQKLKQILEDSGKGSLGMISGSNNKELEGLGDVATINTSGYKTQQETGSVQHNQIGSYTDADGKTQRVDDVWFSV